MESKTNCAYCKKEFISKFKKIKCCSKSCSTKLKFSNPEYKRFFVNRCVSSAKHSNSLNNLKLGTGRKSCKIYIPNCTECGKLFIAKHNSKRVCSSICKSKIFQRVGLKSAAKRVLRSKNEILFANLCGWFFNNIRTNEPIFNGWDADVIIDDIKVAVLWNGIWHYNKVKHNRSLEQAENRDRLKIKQIEKCGYVPYIIKDLGSYDSEFVVEQFNKFLLS